MPPDRESDAARGSSSTDESGLNADSDGDVEPTPDPGVDAEPDPEAALDPAPEEDFEPDLGPDPDVDVPAELARQFWILVVVFNVALLAASVGVMLLVFEGRVRDGGLLLSISGLAFLAGYRGYRRVRATDDESAAE